MRKTEPIEMQKLVSIKAGVAQHRINVSRDDKAPTYYYYTADDILTDLAGAESDPDLSKVTQVRTMDDMEPIKEGDLVFSLITGKAAIVSEQHSGFLITQNFVTLIPDESIDKKYLLFLLNETGVIEKHVLGAKKIAISQLMTLPLSGLPDLRKQREIGDIYLKQKHLTYLRSQILVLREQYVLEKLRQKIDKE